MRGSTLDTAQLHHPHRLDQRIFGQCQFGCERHPARSKLFSWRPILFAPGDSTSLVLFKLSTAPFGSHEIVISGSSTSGNQQVSTILNIVDDMAVVTLASPEDGDESTSPTPTLTWNPEPTAATYYVELATDEAFTDIIVSEELNDTSYTVTESLVDTLTYYWRVRFWNQLRYQPVVRDLFILTNRSRLS